MSTDHDSASETRRRRGSLACNTCRARRTKCDGKRPICSFCAERGKDCFYQGAPEPPPSPLKQELSRIWEQLEHMTGVVQGQSPPPETPPFRKERAYNHALAIKDTFLGFPFMTVQTAAFMDLLGLDRAFPLVLEKMERGRHPVSGRPSGVPIVMVDFQRASDLLHAFAEHIHIWYPILHEDYTDEFLQTIASFFPPSPGSCLALLVLAIGSIVECESVVHALQSRPETIYIQAAMEMLPHVLSDSSLRSTQCLLLFSIYHLCYAQPCQAHDFVAMASYKLQNSLLNDFSMENDHAQMSIFGNCFWSALLIESEITVQLDLVDSGIWNMIPLAPAPASLGSWTWVHDPSALSPTSDTGTGSGPMPSYTITTDLSYFMAEIAMRKMLHHCTWSIRTVAQNNSHAYAPIVAVELERQLDEWHQLLPDGLSFKTSSTFTSYRSQPQVGFLRTQYFAFKASIYWPAAVEVFTTGEASDELLFHCQRFFDSYIEFVMSASVSVGLCKPNIWTLYTSIFTISMGALAALSEPCLSGFLSPRMAHCLNCAVSIFSSVMEISPSLARMGEILRDRTSHALSH
ncbi:hypothetical protein BJX99DRAFT_235642 [Aspergillus californicus]